MKAKVMSLEESRAACDMLLQRYHNRPESKVLVVPVLAHDVPYGWAVQVKVTTTEYLREDGTVS